MTWMFDSESLKDRVLEHKLIILVALTLVLIYMSYGLYLTITAPVINIDPPCSEVVSNGTLSISSSPYLPEDPFSDAEALVFLTTSEFHAYGGVCRFYAIGRGDEHEIGYSTFKINNSTLKIQEEAVEPGLSKTNYLHSAGIPFIDAWHYYSSTIEIERVETADSYRVRTQTFGEANISDEGVFEDEVVVVTGFEHNRSHFNPVTLVLYMLLMGFYAWVWKEALYEGISE